jgi:hypothetical protein
VEPHFGDFRTQFPSEPGVARTQSQAWHEEGINQSAIRET